MMKREPAYIRVYNKLKEDIISGEYPLGELLPPEPVLEQLFDVSRTTVRKAVELLCREGYVTVRQGFGTKVIGNKVSQNLNVLTSISQTLVNKGRRIGVKSTYIEEVPASEEVANCLQIEPRQRVICVQRIQMADDKPIAIAKNYLLPAFVPGIQETREHMVSLYQFLHERYNIVYTAARDRISACSATFEEAQLLEVEPRTALLYIRRVCQMEEKAVEADFVKLIASQYEFEVYMNGQ